MTTDRALELAEAALHEKRAYAKHHGQGLQEGGCEEALRILADLRATLRAADLDGTGEAPQSASEAKRDQYLGEHPSLVSEGLRTAQNGDYCECCDPDAIWCRDR